MVRGGGECPVEGGVGGDEVVEEATVEGESEGDCCFFGLSGGVGGARGEDDAIGAGHVGLLNCG